MVIWEQSLFWLNKTKPTFTVIFVMAFVKNYELCNCRDLRSTKYLSNYFFFLNNDVSSGVQLVICNRFIDISENERNMWHLMLRQFRLNLKTYNRVYWPPGVEFWRQSCSLNLTKQYSFKPKRWFISNQ